MTWATSIKTCRSQPIIAAYGSNALVPSARSWPIQAILMDSNAKGSFTPTQPSFKSSLICHVLTRRYRTKTNYRAWSNRYATCFMLLWFAIRQSVTVKAWISLVHASLVSWKKKKHSGRWVRSWSGICPLTTTATWLESWSTKKFCSTSY